MSIKQILHNPFGYTLVAVVSTFLCGQLLMLTPLPTEDINWPKTAALFPLMGWTLFITVRRRQWLSAALMAAYLLAWYVSFSASKTLGSLEPNELGRDVMLPAYSYFAITLTVAIVISRKILLNIISDGNHKLHIVKMPVFQSSVICGVKAIFGVAAALTVGRYVSTESNWIISLVDYILYGLMLVPLGLSRYAHTPKQDKDTRESVRPAEIQRAA